MHLTAHGRPFLTRLQRAPLSFLWHVKVATIVLRLMLLDASSDACEVHFLKHPLEDMLLHL